MECKSCAKAIGKFDRRIQVDDQKPELWGDRTAGQVGRLHTMDAGIFCCWECLAGYVERQSRPAVTARAS